MRILVAEDEPELLRTYRVLIEDMGHEVITAKDGQECLHYYHRFINENKRFDLVILDYRMPVKNGIEVAKEIASISPSQKILLITAYAGVLDFKDRPETLEVIAKPFDPDELIRVINRSIE